MVNPYEINLGGQPLWVVDKLSTREAYLAAHPEFEPRELGLLAIAAFREQSYVDYLAIGRVDDISETEDWVRAYEQYEWLDWMAGTVYRDPERAKQLRATERELGGFSLRFGWAPDYILETKPSSIEFDGFVEHVADKDLVGGVLILPEGE